MFIVMPPSILQLEKVGIDGKVFFITCLLKNWWLLFLGVVWDDICTKSEFSDVDDSQIGLLQPKDLGGPCHLQRILDQKKPRLIEGLQ